MTQDSNDNPAGAEDSFDASQQAMHGLLRVYFESDSARDAARADAILGRLSAEAVDRACAGPTERPARAPADRAWDILAGGLRPLCRSWSVRAGLAAAVGLVLILTLLVDRGRPARATPSSVGFDGQFLSTCVPPTLGLFKDDPDAMRRLWESISTARRERDEAMKAVLTAAGEENIQLRLGEVMHAWTRLYRRLRNVGEWEEALRETNGALAYTRDALRRERLKVWHFVVLADLGGLHAARGDFEAAREAYRQSIEARRVDALAHPQPTDVECLAKSLPPLHWRMGKLALLGGSLDEAWEWQGQAEAELRGFFIEVCRRTGVDQNPLRQGGGRVIGSNGLAPLEGLTLWQAFEAVPAEFRDPPPWYRSDDPAKPPLPDGSLETEGHVKARFNGMLPNASIVSLVRAHLVQEARLRRHAGDYSDAKAALRQAATMRYYAVHDEYSLLFAEPLEAAWIAIAEKDYDTALAKVEEARTNTTAVQVSFDPNLSKPAVSPMALAELDLLEGMALVGKAPADTEGHNLVKAAMAIPSTVAANLTARERDQFMRQFQNWMAAVDGQPR